MKKAFIQLHIAILLAGCSGILGNLISLDAVLITWYRMLLAGLMLIIILYIKGNKPIIQKNEWRELSVGLLLALHWIFFYGSIKYANVSIGVICFCLSSFFTAIISPMLNRQKISWTELLLSSLTLFGISLIFQFDSSYRIGIGFGVVSSLLFAFYAILNERLSASRNAVRTTALQMIGGFTGLSVLLLPVYIMNVRHATYLPTINDFCFLFLLAFGCTVCMCFLLNNAQKEISAFTVSLSFNLEPVYSILLAIILFKENKMFGTAFYAGLSLIMLSLVLQMFRLVYNKNKKFR
ncbi:MAG: DMT family transporter [Parabacteroides sp.]|nr:DMT family transporter [Parabacteroides sp.]